MSNQALGTQFVYSACSEKVGEMKRSCGTWDILNPTDDHKERQIPRKPGITRSYGTIGIPCCRIYLEDPNFQAGLGITTTSGYDHRAPSRGPDAPWVFPESAAIPAGIQQQALSRCARSVALLFL